MVEHGGVPVGPESALPVPVLRDGMAQRWAALSTSRAPSLSLHFGMPAELDVRALRVYTHVFALFAPRPERAYCTLQPLRFDTRVVDLSQP